MVEEFRELSKGNRKMSTRNRLDVGASTMSTDCAHKSPRALLGSSPPPTVAQWSDGRTDGAAGGELLLSILSYDGSTELTPQVSPDSFLEILTSPAASFLRCAFNQHTHTHTHTFARRKQAFRSGVGERCPPALLLPFASALWPPGKVAVPL